MSDKANKVKITSQAQGTIEFIDVDAEPVDTEVQDNDNAKPSYSEVSPDESKEANDDKFNDEVYDFRADIGNKQRS